MRSRYSAFVFENAEYLLQSWHPSTRPAELDFNLDNPSRMRTVWLGLSVKSHRLTAENQAEVEFVARCRIGGGRAERLHERSRFIFEEGRWYYVDGDINPRA
jgi:SEC-C motif-containing protein